MLLLQAWDKDREKDALARASAPPRPAGFDLFVGNIPFTVGQKVRNYSSKEDTVQAVTSDNNVRSFCLLIFSSARNISPTTHHRRYCM